MLTLPLIDIHYTQLAPDTWCATAALSDLSLLRPLISSTESILYKKRRKRQQQRDGVRLLLQQMLIKLSINDILDESDYPYRLVNSGYYVCFSHSDDGLSVNKVAVAICRYRPIGIDIETQAVLWPIVQRFYHPAELTILSTLSMQQQSEAIKHLWQLKESFIKINNHKLAQGLGINYSAMIPTLIDKDTIAKNTVNDDFDRLTIIETKPYTTHQIALLSYQQTLVVF